jgi:hypothetical protein
MKRIHKAPVVHHTTPATHTDEEVKAKPHLAHSPASTTLTVESAATAPIPPVSPAATPAVSTPTISFIAMPPDANIPSTPTGWVAGPAEDYRGSQPRAAELTNLEGAITDLQRFTNFTQVFGNTVPPPDQIIQLLQAGGAWSAMRVATAEWDGYAQAQEGLAWVAIRLVMAALRSAFDLALQANGSLATMYPSLTSLLTAQKVIARKGASTRAANKAAEAKGETPSHGKVGKARMKAAAKAALKATTASSAATAQTVTAPASPPVAAVANGASNGVGGSSTGGTSQGH